MVGIVGGSVREGRRHEREHELLVHQIRTVTGRRESGVRARLVVLLIAVELFIGCLGRAGRAEEGATVSVDAVAAAAVVVIVVVAVAVAAGGRAAGGGGCGGVAVAVVVVPRDEFGFLVRCCE